MNEAFERFASWKVTSWSVYHFVSIPLYEVYQKFHFFYHCLTNYFKVSKIIFPFQKCLLSWLRLIFSRNNLPFIEVYILKIYLIPFLFLYDFLSPYHHLSLALLTHLPLSSFCFLTILRVLNRINEEKENSVKSIDTFSLSNF